MTMETLYKLTQPDMTTYGGMQWRLNRKREVKAGPPVLCTASVIHAYRDPDLALLLNPNHADIAEPRLFRAEGTVVIEDWGKVGCDELVLREAMDIPLWANDKKIARSVRVAFAVLCAESVLPIFEARYPRDQRPPPSHCQGARIPRLKYR